MLGHLLTALNVFSEHIQYSLEMFFNSEEIFFSLQLLQLLRTKCYSIHSDYPKQIHL